MDPDGGSVAIPEGARIKGTDDELVTEVSTLQFLFDAKRQLQDLLNAGPSNVSRIQKENATKLINEINNTIKNVKNADPNWANAFDSLIEAEAKALAIRKLPIIQALGSEGRFKELLKGYMSEDFSVSDINMLRQTMDENAFAAFSQGFFNQITGSRGVPNSLST
jgi:malate synthase